MNGTSAAISHYAGTGESLSWKTVRFINLEHAISRASMAPGAIQNSGQASALLQLHDLQGNIVATASLSETETKLLSTVNSTEFGVPQTSTAMPRFLWLGAAGLTSELPGSGVVTTGEPSYVPRSADS